MKNPLSIIRWKFVVPVALFVAAVVVFLIVFFDPLLTKGLEKIGGKLNGAKVDITGLKTKLAQGRLSIQRLQITNRKEPMKNIVEAGPLAFEISLSDIFSKRVIIPEAKLGGLQFNTDRKISGALPKIKKKEEDKDKKPSAAAQLVDKYKDQFKLNLDGLKDQAKSKIEFDPKDLKLIKQGDDLKEKAEALPDQWKSRIETLNAEGRLKQIEEDLKAIKNTPTKGTEALVAIPASLAKLKKVKDDINKLKEDVVSVKQALSAEIQGLKGDIKNLQTAKKADIDDLLSRLNLDFADPDRLVEGLVGGALMTRFQTALNYLEIVRQHMPSKKEKESLPPKPRLKGIDIPFPTPAAPPRFWLKKASLEGTFQEVTAAGSLTHATSDPARIGKPLSLNLNGKRGEQTFLARGVFDHTGDVNKDGFEIDVQGLEIKKMASGGDLDKTLTEGRGKARFALNVIGDQLGGQLTLALSGLKLDDNALLEKVGVPSSANLSREDSLKASFMKSVAQAIEKMPEVALQAKVLGTWQDPAFQISSNLGSALSNVIKDSLGNAIKDQKKQLEAELDKLLKSKAAELESKIAGLQGQWGDKVGGLDKRVQQALNDATGIKLSPDGESGSSPLPGVKIPSLDKLFKR